MRLDLTHISTPIPQHTRSTEYAVRERPTGWAVERTIWFIDRNGEKDAQADDVSVWPTEAEALAESVALYSMPAVYRKAA